MSQSVQYAEAPSFFTVNKVANLNTFKLLEKEDMHNLNNLLNSKTNDIWLKIEFEIPSELKNKDLGLYIGQLKSADSAWINLIPCGSYGRFPPYELPAGYGAQHFTLNHSVLKREGINTILIRIWSGCQVSLSDAIFVSEEIDSYKAAEKNLFFKSKIILCFACVSFIAFFLYLMLHLFLRKFSTSRTYLFYSILMIFTVMTLLPFCLTEIPWIKPKSISYFNIMKYFLTFGTYSTIYYVNKFIISYLGVKENKYIIVTRIVLYLIPLAITLFVTNYNQVPFYLSILLPITSIQFIFSLVPAIKTLQDRRLRKKTILLFVSVIPAIIGLIIDLCSTNFAKVSVVLPQASIYGWQITTYIFIIRLLHSFAEMYIKNTKLKNNMVKFNAQLENEVESRTKELSEKNFILSRGLEAITLVQQEVLPKQSKTFKGWDISVKYVPLDNEVSGDLYDYYFTGTKLDGLSIIDISGHGIPAGLMSILAKGIISQQYLDGLANHRPMSEVLLKINDIYIKEKVNVENYFTGLIFNFFEFDSNDICPVQMANAGHPAPLLYSAEENTVKEVKYERPEMQYGFIGVDGLPISFPATNFKMAQNDILVCFTDGIIEAMNTNKEEFTKKRLADILQQSKDLSSDEIRDNIIKELKSFIAEEPLSDDITLIVLKRNRTEDYLEEI